MPWASATARRDVAWFEVHARVWAVLSHTASCTVHCELLFDLIRRQLRGPTKGVTRGNHSKGDCARSQAPACALTAPGRSEAEWLRCAPLLGVEALSPIGLPLEGRPRPHESRRPRRPYFMLLQQVPLPSSRRAAGSLTWLRDNVAPGQVRIPLVDARL